MILGSRTAAFRWCPTSVSRWQPLNRSYASSFVAQRMARVVSVFMGQGEPLYNWRNLVPTVDVITDHDALNIAARRVTVSTSGVAPLIPKVGSVLNVNLAVSLHAPEDSLRSQIMGINDTYPLSVLMQKCKEYTGMRVVVGVRSGDRGVGVRSAPPYHGPSDPLQLSLLSDPRNCPSYLTPHNCPSYLTPHSSQAQAARVI